jgi:hypothetical protein
MHTTRDYKWIAIILAAAAISACKKAVVEQKDNGAELAKKQAEKDAADKAAKEKAAKEKAAADAKKSVDDALTAFGAEANGAAEQRRKTYLALVDAIEKSKGAMDTSVYKGLPIGAATPFFARLKQIDDDEVVDDKNAPNIPPKPEHNPPKYAGAYPLSGAVRKCYKDGVVLQAGAKFYFIDDAKCLDANYLRGYVEPEGRTINVDIGRDGRDAEVVKISDKESAADDRAAHNKAVADYEADYAKKLKEYQDATNGKEAVVAALEKRRGDRKKEREELWATLDTLLKPAAEGAKAGTDLSTVKLPSVAAPKVSGTGVPAAAPAPTVAGAPTPPAADSDPAPAPAAASKTGGSWTPKKTTEPTNFKDTPY